MSRSLKVNSQYIQEVKAALKLNKLRTQRALAEDLEMALSTVSRFLNGRPVDYATFLEICDRLNLDWQTVAAFEKLSKNLSAGQDNVTNHPTDQVSPNLPQVEAASRVVEPATQMSQQQGPISLLQSPPLPKPYRDWGESVDVSFFYGRSHELATLERMLLEDRCRLVSIIGLGGIGKTTLAAKLAQDIQDQFDYVIWRSLYNAPPLEAILKDLVLFLSQQQDTEATIPRLLHWLRQSRCLVILDNTETILQGHPVGQFKPDYADYEHLFYSLGETAHNSATLLTSREKPAIMATLEGLELAVRSLPLEGSIEASQALIEAKGLVGSVAEKAQLSQCYGYNPLAIKIVATSVQSIFDGNMSVFLKQHTTVFNGLRRFLSQQFERLSPLELTLLYWLAVKRTWVSIQDLSRSLYPGVSQAKLLEALESLSWRSMIEVRAGQYTLQPMVMEYVTEQLIDEISQDLSQGVTQGTMTGGETEMSAAPPPPLPLFHRLALLTTTAHDYIRNSQRALILQPIADRLKTKFSVAGSLAAHLKVILQQLRANLLLAQGYGAGNCLNLYQQLQIDICGIDVSHLTIRQADLRQCTLRNSNCSQARFLDTLFLQSFGSVTTVSLSPNGAHLVTGDSHNEIRLWQIQDGQLLLTMQGHTGWIFDLAFSPDNAQLASSSVDYTVKVWDLETGTCLRTLRGHRSAIWSVAFSPDGHTLASGSDDQTVRLWDAHTGRCLQVLPGQQSWVRGLAFNPQGDCLVTGSRDHILRLWDLATGSILKQFSGHIDQVWSVTFSPDGKLIASGSLDHTIRLWDVASGKCIQVLQGHSNQIWSVAFSPEGKQLASGSLDQTVRLWDVGTGQCMAVFQGHQDTVRSIDFSTDGRFIASGSFDQSVKLWDIATRECWRTLRGFTNQIRTLSFDNLGQRVISGSDDSRLRLWDVATGRCLKKIQGHRSGVWFVDFCNPTSPSSPAGLTDLVVSGGYEPLLKFWDVTTGQCIKSINTEEPWIRAIAFDDQAKILASCGIPPLVKLWDMKTGQCLRVLSGHTDQLWHVAFSPDRKQLASASSDYTVKFWSVDTGECLQTYAAHDDWVYALDFAANGTLDTGYSFVTGGADQFVKIWHSKTKECVHCLSGHQDWVYAVAFSPDGKLVASGSFDHTVKIWDAVSGDCLHTLRGHTHEVWDVTFSPVDNILASSSADTTIKLWDLQTGVCMHTLTTPKPYEGMNIMDVQGLTIEQRMMLKSLGAIESI